MASSTKLPGTGTGADWANPDRITADDGSNATVTLNGGLSTTTLDGTDCGFAIPAGATINGIEATVKCGYTGGLTVFADVQVNHAGTWYSAGDTSSTSWSGPVNFGSATELWGVTWTPANINTAGFGVRCTAQWMSATPSDLTVDCYIVTVYYTEAGSATPRFQTRVSQ